jgi:NADH dehydrogenase [ubiquinone] 1 alpha subcomplex assembly factor 6
MTTIPGYVNAVRGKLPLPGKRSITAEASSPVAALVRRHDRDRFQTALFAPAARREALFALYAFNYEIARVRERVREPTLGRIRLEWWRETIDLAYRGAPVRRHPVAEALVMVIRAQNPTRDHFERLIDGREADLDHTPSATLAALEAYAESTSSCVIYLALELLGVRDDEPALAAARNLGIAYALAGLLRALPWRSAAGRPVIPVDIARRSGLDPDLPPSPANRPALRRAVEEIAAAARNRLAEARRLSHRIPAAAAPALLSAVIAERSLRRLEQAGFDPFAPGLQEPDPLQMWRLALAALRGRF